MKKTKRSAFTIVELVIVIAVIAILSAVLIPTFGAIIKDANLAADKAAASTLTSELHVYLKGKQIKNEADLVDALNKSGVGAKLTPKAEGVHYWFDVENQMIVVKELTEVNRATRAATPANTSFRDLYNKGLYLVDYYVLGELFSTADVAYDVFSYIDNLSTADQYANLISVLGGVADNHAYKTIANDILNKIHNTTIRTEAGAFFSAEGNATKFEYFSASATFIGSEIYKYDATAGENPVSTATATPLPVGVVAISEHLDYISEDALIYANTAESTAQISIDRSRTGILSPGFTNADVLIGDKTYRIVDPVDDRLVNIAVADGSDYIQLIIKLPFEEFDIYFEGENALAGMANDKIFVAYRSGTLQLNAINKADSSQTSNKIQSWSIVDGEYGKFEINSTGLINFENAEFVTLADGTQVCEVTVKAETLNINNDTRTETINIVIVKPISSNLKVVSTTSQNVTMGTNKTIELDFTGEFTSYEVVHGITYSSEVVADGETPTDAQALLGLSPIFAVADNNNFHFDVANNKLVFKAVDANGDEIYDNGTYSFVISVDGNCLATTVTATMKNSEDTIFKTNHHHNSTIARPFYIGSDNEISLGAIFNAAVTDFGVGKIEKATVNIYDNVGATGKLYPIYLADRTPNDFNVVVGENAIGSLEIGYGDWANQKLTFVFEPTLNDAGADTSLATHTTHDVYIEIIPETNDNVSDAISTVVKFTVIRGAKNVSDINDLKPADSNAIVLDKDVILQGDSVVTTGTTIDVDEHTLYGNGYIINATEYKAEKTGETDTKVKYTYELKTVCNNPSCSNYKKEAASGVCYKTSGCSTEYICSVKKNQSFKTTSTDGTYNAFKTNQALIVLNGGTIDNIYIDGPVYPTLQYYLDDSNDNSMTVSTGYYVSGIKVTSTGTIQNSYVSGFRQPVSAQGTSLRVDNTTLEGGNYANLQLVTGTLTLNNVTTVQNPDGMQPTVDNTEADNVIGLGVAVEKDALTSTINITGYLNQYNWVPENTDATLPTINGINLDSIFGFAFEGVGGMKISRFLEFMHLDEANEQYFNAGFIFANIGDSATINALDALKKPTENSRVLIGENNFTTGSTLGKIEVRLNELSGNETVDGLVMAMFNGADGQVYIYTYKDNRKYDYSKDEVDNTKTDWSKVITLSDAEGSVHPITYKGYYTGYGN